MIRRRITATRTEVFERWSVRERRSVSQINICVTGGVDHVWMSLDSASKSTGLSPVELCKLVQAESIHWAHTTEGHLILCKASIEGFLGEG